MAITMLDVDWSTAIIGGKNPLMTNDFNASKSQNQDQKRYRMVAGRVSAADADVIYAHHFGLKTIRSAVFQSIDVGFVVSMASLSNIGSQNNGITFDILKHRGTNANSAGVGTQVRLSYFVAGDR